MPKRNKSAFTAATATRAVSIALAIATVLSACSGAGVDPRTAPAVDISTFKIQTAELKKTYSDDSVSVDLQYPQLSQTEDSKATKRINKHQQHQVETAIKVFREQTRAIDIAQMPEGTRSTMSSKFETTLLDHSIASFNLLIQPQYAGSEENFSFRATYTYDLRTGNILGLEDLFPEGEYLKLLADYTRDDLRRQFGTEELSKQAIEATIDKEKSFQSFSLTPDQVVIYFAAGVVAEPSKGIVEVRLDKSLFDTMVNKNLPNVKEWIDS